MNEDHTQCQGGRRSQRARESLLVPRYKPRRWPEIRSMYRAVYTYLGGRID